MDNKIIETIAVEWRKYPVGAKLRHCQRQPENPEGMTFWRITGPTHQ